MVETDINIKVYSVVADVACGVLGELLIASVLYDDDGFILTDDSGDFIDLNL